MCTFSILSSQILCVSRNISSATCQDLKIWISQLVSCEMNVTSEAFFDASSVIFIWIIHAEWIVATQAYCSRPLPGEGSWRDANRKFGNFRYPTPNQTMAKCKKKWKALKTLPKTISINMPLQSRFLTIKRSFARFQFWITNSWHWFCKN